MARRNREVGFVKSCVLASALIAGLALPAQADDKKLTLSATTVFTTDYIFRGYSATGNGPAVQPEFDLSYGIFYAGIWGSNIKPAAATNVFTGVPENVADIEIDYYAGIGARAYSELADRLGGSLTEVYRELAGKFPAFIEVLHEIRRRVDFAGADVVTLYEQWLRSRDEWVERKLRSFGVLVDPDGRPIH